VSGWTVPGLLQGNVSLTVPSASVPALLRLNVSLGPIRIRASVGHLPVPKAVADAAPAGPGDSARQ
jgi:hypothetical protein